MTSPRPALLLAWLVATALLVVAFRAAGWHHVAEIGARIDSVWLVVAVCGNLAIQPFAAIQWRLLLPRGSASACGRCSRSPRSAHWR